MNKIIIAGLEVNCIVGIKPEERLKTQQVIVDIKLSTDLSKAAETDDVNDTVDYDSLSENIVGFIEKSDFRLLEKLAYETAKLAKEISKAREVTIAIKKPAAIKRAKYASVELSL